MDNKINWTVKRAIESTDKHYLFGFHDLLAWNHGNDRLLAIETERIDVPPSSTNQYPIGYVDGERQFHKFGDTRTFNYPQGARQQWIGKTQQVIVNDLRGNKVISKIYDTDDKQQVNELNYPTHVITDSGWAFGIDYGRLHRLGAYGYHGALDQFASEDAPEHVGILKHNIHNGESHLILSLKDIANYKLDPSKGKHHYITHLVLSPDQSRIAFLHRFKLSDGGETTRLCTIGINGADLRCLASGFMSHFDWMDNSNLMICGRIGSNVEKLRNSTLYNLIPSDLLAVGKKLIKKAVGRKKGVPSANKFWLKVSDEINSEITRVGEGIMISDGHPMFNPIDRKWLINDTYPNLEGIRELFLYNHTTNSRIELGKFHMINVHPDLKLSEEILIDIDPDIMKTVGLRDMAFTRSGLHCDLHPRWSPDGKKVAFDSIHEGFRSIYVVQLENFVQ